MEPSKPRQVFPVEIAVERVLQLGPFEIHCHAKAILQISSDEFGLRAVSSKYIRLEHIDAGFLKCDESELVHRLQEVILLPAKWGDVEVSGLRLRGVAHYFELDNTVSSEASLEGHLETSLPLAFECDDQALLFALRHAAEYLRMPIRIDAISLHEGFYVFPVFQVGLLGVAISKDTGELIEMGSGLCPELWIWGHQKGLLVEAGDIVIDRVHEMSALVKLKKFLKSPAHAAVESLPFRLNDCAHWTAVSPLFEAGNSIEWHVESKGPA